jgi:DNA (cytosine-5)-methyltransferase 1
MTLLRVLNMYAGIGGNRALWPNSVGERAVKITSIENDPDVAEAYRVLWPDDELLVCDAHNYLADHLTDGWDFIWSSPPCTSHSKLQQFVTRRSNIYRYPQLEQLYGEILLLKHFAPSGTAWIVENTIPYYEPLIPPTTKLDRHYAWSNTPLPYVANSKDRPRIASEKLAYRKNQHHSLSPIIVSTTQDLERAYGITLPACADNWGASKRRQVMRNCVMPSIGKAVWDQVFNRHETLQGTLMECVS